MNVRAQRFEDLDVYQAAFALQQQVYSLSQTWPREESFALTDQIRRASRSIGANLAEAWAKRRYGAHFVSKLTDADGELNETRHWIRTARSCGYVGDDVANKLSREYDRIGRMLGKILSEPHLWVRDLRGKSQIPANDR